MSPNAGHDFNNIGTSIFVSNQRNAFLLVVSSDCNWNNFIPKDNIKRKLVTNRGDTRIADAVLVICVSPLNAVDGVYNI